MRWIDQFAYGNRITRLNPAIKVGLSLVVLLIALIANNPLISIALLFFVFLLIIFWAELPATGFLKILFTESGFLFLSVLGVTVSISTTQSEGARQFLGLWFVMTEESLILAGNLFLRALACTAAMNFMAMTTPMIDIIHLLQKIKLPDFLIDMMSLTYRFIFTLLDTLTRMITAKEARLGFNSFRTGLRSWGDIGTGLLIESIRRSQKLEMAMESRCWNGTIRVLSQPYEPFTSSWKKDKIL